MRVIFSAVFIVAMALSSAMAETAEPEWTQHEEHVQFEELPVSVEESLLKSVTLNEPFSPEQEPVEHGNPEFAKFWKLDSPEWQATIKHIKLSFIKPSADPETPQPDDSLLVTVTFAEQAVVVVLDKPKHRKFMGGMRFPLKKDRNWHQMFDAIDGDSLAILVPRFGDDNLYGVVLCPAEYKIEKPGEIATSLGASEFKLSKVSFTPFADVRIKFQSGVGVGRGQAWIQTSPNIPRSRPLSDQTVSRDPFVSLEYSPDVSEAMPNFALPDFVDGQASITAGIRVNLDLQNVAGYRRVSALDDVLWLKQIELQQPFTARSVSREVDVNPSSCILLAKRQSVAHSYSREERPSAPTIAATP